MIEILCDERATYYKFKNISTKVVNVLLQNSCLMYKFYSCKRARRTCFFSTFTCGGLRYFNVTVDIIR